MERLVHRYKDTYLKMDKKHLVDSQTGEIDNIEKASIIKRETEGTIQFNSTCYNFIDTHSLRYAIKKNIKQVDIALLITMSSNLLMNYNICLDVKDNPLTADTTAKMIGQSRQSTKRKINRLISHGLFFHGVYRLKRSLGKVYIINPYLIRRGHKFSDGLATLFDDAKNVQKITYNEYF